MACMTKIPDHSPNFGGFGGFSPWNFCSTSISSKTAGAEFKQEWQKWQKVVAEWRRRTIGQPGFDRCDKARYPLVTFIVGKLTVLLLKMAQSKSWIYPAIKWWIFPVRYVVTFTRPGTLVTIDTEESDGLQGSQQAPGGKGKENRRGEEAPGGGSGRNVGSDAAQRCLKNRCFNMSISILPSVCKSRYLYLYLYLSSLV